MTETQEDLLAIIQTQQKSIDGLSKTVGDLLDMAKMAHLKDVQHDEMLMMPRRKRLAWSLANNGFTEDFAVSVTLYFWTNGQVSHTKYPEWAPCPHDTVSSGKGTEPYCVDCGSWIDND
jgi:hypothetical protein